MASMKPSTTRLRACPAANRSAVVRSFMTHHQGMSFLSLAYLLLDRPMQKRFESDPLFQATMLLLQERIPKATTFYVHADEITGSQPTSSVSETPVRVFNSPDTPIPEVQLLSNGRYHVMLTNAGGGYSRWKDIAVTRWREDSTCDNWGTFCYLRDVASGEFWSTAYQPTLKRSGNYEAIFSEGRGEFRCRENDFDTHTEIAVSPEDDIELRRITITNRARTRREIDVTSYAEVVLAPPAGGCTASGLQQSLCSDRDYPPPAGDPVHSPAPLPRGAGALDVSPDGGARGGDRGDFLRD